MIWPFFVFGQNSGPFYLDRWRYVGAIYVIITLF